MSQLIKCEKCKAEIADDAETCPKCGGETNHSKTSSILGWLIVIGVVWYFDLINKLLDYIN